MFQTHLFEIDRTNEIINVAQVKQLSPFRYPGGKTWLVPRFFEWVSKRTNKPKFLIEPFAGGGIISLSAAYVDLVERCIMVEKDEEVAAVWKTIIYGNWQNLSKRIMNFKLDIDSAKKVIEASPACTEDIAFRTILKNRVFHGGILAPGSGFLKNGENGKGILSRWYPATLATRIKTIAEMRDKLEFHEGDAFDFIEQYSSSDEAIFFIDPPYTASKKNAGKRLYTHHEIDHEMLFSKISSVKGDFLMTYDFDDNVIRLIEDNSLRFDKILMKGTSHSKRIELLIEKSSN